MTDVTAGAAAPAAAPSTPAPGAQPVQAPDLPAGQEQAPPSGEPPVKPTRTFTEEEHRKGISERLAKERRRMERVVRAELRAEMAEKQLQELREPRDTNQPKGAPKEADFKDYETYLLAKAKYEIRQEMEQEQQRTRTETAAQQRAREEREQAEAVLTRFDAARQKHEDFDEVVFNERAPFTTPMMAFFGDSERGGDLAYNLGRNLPELQRISALSPAGQFRELVKLEASMSTTPKPTQAPPPIVPSSANAAASKDYAQMSTKEHIEAWSKRKR